MIDHCAAAAAADSGRAGEARPECLPSFRFVLVMNRYGEEEVGRPGRERGSDKALKAGTQQRELTNHYIIIIVVVVVAPNGQRSRVKHQKFTSLSLRIPQVCTFTEKQRWPALWIPRLISSSDTGTLPSNQERVNGCEKGRSVRDLERCATVKCSSFVLLLLLLPVIFILFNEWELKLREYRHALRVNEKGEILPERNTIYKI